MPSSGEEVGMKKYSVLIIGMSVVLTSSLWADPPLSSQSDPSGYTMHLRRDERRLMQRQAIRLQDQLQMNRAQDELSGSQTKLSVDQDQQRQDVEELKSVEDQLTAGHSRETLDHTSYRDAVRKYGRDHPASTAAQETLKGSRQVVCSLRETRQSLKTKIRQGRHLVYSDKTIMGMKKRDVDSHSRCLVKDDVDIQKKEKAIASDSSDSAQNRQISMPTVESRDSPISGSN
jgi:hypothetical protein